MIHNKFLVLIGILLLVALPNIFSSENVLPKKNVSVTKELNKDSIAKRCRLLENTSAEIDYLKIMYNFSVKRDSADLQCIILARMIKNYYNRSIGDSLNYYFKKLEKVALAKKMYRQFFDSYNLLCSYELYDQNYDKALDNANKLYSLAKEMNNDDGLIASYENIGIIYMETFRYVEAIKAFKEGLDLLEKQKAKRYGYRFQFISYIIESYLKMRDFKGVEINLTDALNLLDEWKKYDCNLPYNRCLWLLNCYYIEMYVGLNQPKKAYKYLEDSKKIMNDVNDDFVSVYYYYVCALYYQQIKDYPQALSNINEILGYSSYFPAMQLRGKLFLESKKYKEAALAFDSAINELDSTYNECFSKQINQLRTIHEVDRLELRNKELEIGSRTLKLRIVFFFALLFLIISLVSALYIIRIRRIRNKLRISDKMLKEDKKKLMISEAELIKAKDKAEKSSKYKDIFLANMNHEVRTPLNAIVGFSSLISEMAENCNAQEYADIIRYNTGILLKLINDTVDASSMQADILQFKFEPCEINDLCQSLITELKPKVNANVQLIFTPCDDGKFDLITDRVRLKQLLYNLLLNSIKFTEKGHIILHYEICQDKKQVEFIVEDTGKGIPEDMQNYIFESFNKIDVFKQGLGIGLTLVRLISHKLNGKVHIDSLYKDGTRIIFDHPIN